MRQRLVRIGNGLVGPWWLQLVFIPGGLGGMHSKTHPSVWWHALGAALALWGAIGALARFVATRDRDRRQMK
jgi:hypothetical protein